MNALNTLAHSLARPPGLAHLQKKCEKYLESHPRLSQIAVIAAYAKRTLAELALLYILPFSLPVNCLLMALGSYAYAIAIEKRCPFPISSLSCIGAIGIRCALAPIAALISGAAFASLYTFGCAMLRLLPLGVWIFSVIRVSYDEVYRVLELKRTPPPAPSSRDCCHA